MNVDLKLDDLINLLNGIYPPLNEVAELERKGLGNYNGSYGTWTWNKYTLKGLTETRLFEMYLKYKQK